MGLIERFPEINFSNYNEDDVRALQAWAFEAIDQLRDSPSPTSSETELDPQRRLNQLYRMISASIKECRDIKRNHSGLKQGHYPHIGSVLNAYREGDLLYDEAVAEIEKATSRDDRAEPGMEEPTTRNAAADLKRMPVEMHAKLRELFRDQSMTFACHGDLVTICCEGPTDAQLIYDWLSEWASRCEPPTFREQLDHRMQLAATARIGLPREIVTVWGRKLTPEGVEFRHGKRGEVYYQSTTGEWFELQGNSAHEQFIAIASPAAEWWEPTPSEVAPSWAAAGCALKCETETARGWETATLTGIDARAGWPYLTEYGWQSKIRVSNRARKQAEIETA